MEQYNTKNSRYTSGSKNLQLDDPCYKFEPQGRRVKRYKEDVL